MDGLCTDESDVLFEESSDTGKSKPASRSRSAEPAHDTNEISTQPAQPDLQRSNSVSPSRRRPERAKSIERKPISGVLTMKPTNLEKQMDIFFSSSYRTAPRFTYAKSDSCVHKAFCENSNVCFELLPDAERILARAKSDYGSSEAFLERLYGDDKTDPNELRQKILEYLKDHNMEERVKVKMMDNGLSAASVSKAYCQKQGKYMYTVSIAKVPFSSNMIQGTCDHEIGTHLLRMRNDEMQVWHGVRDKYRLGNPWITEEGFATLNTYQSMPCKLLFPQALRYYAVCRGAKVGFVELFHELQGYVDNPKLNWQMCCRVKRGLFDTSQPGAFNMDQAYFKGAVEILQNLNEIDLVQLYSGQVALQDLDKIKFLFRREEIVLPWFLNCPEALEVYKAHCQELIRENQIECSTGRRPSLFRAAVDLLKRIPRLTKATPAFLQRKVSINRGSKAAPEPTINKSTIEHRGSKAALEPTISKSTIEQDRVSVTEQVQQSVAQQSVPEKPQPNDASSSASQDLRQIGQMLDIGKYEVTYEGVRVGPEAELGHPAISHIPKGTHINVLEITRVEQRIRARVASPAGWISLMNTESGFQWATPIESTSAPGLRHSPDKLQDIDKKQERVSVAEQVQQSVAPPKVPETPQRHDACSNASQDLQKIAEMFDIGEYRVTYEGISVGPQAELGHPAIAYLPKDRRVNVLEITRVEQRIRARITSPAGWISLMNTESGFQWAAPIESTSAPSLHHPPEDLQDTDMNQDETQKRTCQQQSHPSEVLGLADRQDHRLQATRSEHPEQGEDELVQRPCGCEPVTQLESSVNDNEENETSQENHSNEEWLLADPQHHQPQEPPRSEQQVHGEDELVQGPGSCEHVKQVEHSVNDREESAVLAESSTSKPSPQPQDGMDELENVYIQEEAERLQIAAPSSNGASKNLLVKDPNAPIERASLTSLPDADQVLFGTMLPSTESCPKAKAAGDSMERSASLPVDLMQAVRDLADAVNEWKVLKAEFEENYPNELPETVAPSSKSRRQKWKRRSSSKVEQETAACMDVLCGCAVTPEKVADDKPRRRHKRKSRKSTSNKANDPDLNSVI